MTALPVLDQHLPQRQSGTRDAHQATALQCRDEAFGDPRRIASMASRMRSAAVSGEPTKSISGPGAPKRSIARWLAGAPPGELVERTLLAVGGQPRQRLVEIAFGKVDVGDRGGAGQRTLDEVR
jgi:hypothetical protein